MPWAVLFSHIEPHYPKTGRQGRQSKEPENMFHICCTQNWFSPSDRQMEDALYEIESMHRFVGFAEIIDAFARRNHDTEFPSPFGAAQIDGNIARYDQYLLQDSGATGFQGYGGGRHTHTRPKFDQESGMRDERVAQRCTRRRRKNYGTLA